MKPAFFMALAVLSMAAPRLHAQAVQSLNVSAAVPGAATAFHGFTGGTTAPAPRLEGAVTVDGVLDEPVWGQAVLLTGFSRYLPADGQPAEDSTEVLLWYSANAIHFGIRAFAPEGTVNAQLADRDKIASDDYVQILLDTFDDRRQALIFAVNPLGVQSDGIKGALTFGAAGTLGGRADRATDEDLTPDFLFDSKGRLTPYGYEVEIRIPFKSIRYQSAAPQDWGINIIRKIQRSGFEDTWAPVRLAGGPFLSQSGRITGLTGLRRGLVLDLNPVATGQVAGLPAAGAGWEYGEARPEFGLNTRWGVTTNLTLDGTVNPDFSQVEADAGQITINQRFPVFFAEKRPFFLEGVEKFSTPNRLIHTRQIASPEGGLKLTGKLSGVDIGLLSAVDHKRYSASGQDLPVYNLVRLRRDVGPQSTVGMVYTDRIEGSNYNRVAGMDARLVFARQYYLQMQIAGSMDRTAGVTSRAPLWELTVDRSGRSFTFNNRITGIHPAFKAGSGFIPRPGIIGMASSARFTRFGRPGALLESWNVNPLLDLVWNYHGLAGGEAPIEVRVWLTGNSTFRGGWKLNGTVAWESFAFEPPFYEGYALERAAPGGALDTVPFVPPARLDNVIGAIARLTTPEFTRFSGNVSAVVSHDISHFEPAAVWYLSTSGELNWRPTDKLRLTASVRRLKLNRTRDGTLLSVQTIPRLKLEFQPSRAVFVRFVGQYDAAERDGLRDPRTDEPILLRNAAGVYVRTARQFTNNVRVDWLFSFRPNPGTLVYAGYGSSLTETSPFNFGNLRRTSDGFFLKVSYLFRV